MRASTATLFDPTADLRAIWGTAREWLAHILAAMAPGRPSAETGAKAHAATAAASADFQRLILPHLDAAYSLARYLSRDATACEDIVQEAFLKAFRSFGGFRGGDARAWILTIVRNTTRDWHNRQKIERRLMQAPPDVNEDDDLQPDAIETIASDVESAESMLVRDGEDRRIRAVVERMPEKLREVLVLREMEDLSYREIADVTQLPIGTVMSRLARAREAFAAIWLRVEKTRGAAS
jgi:RNA polymerase sigma-70 factor (ECF subfamily)